jgi:PAS domain S-box-containing protein
MAETRDCHPGVKTLEQQREQALAWAGIGMYRYNFAGVILFADTGVLHILELEEEYDGPDGLAGHHIRDVLEYRGPEGGMREAVRECGAIRNREWCFRTLGGRDKWVMEDSFLVEGGEVIQVVMRDITYLKTTEHALAASVRQFHETLEAAHLVAIRFDREGRILYCNPFLYRLTGWEEADLIHRFWIDRLVPREGRDLVRNAFMDEGHLREDIPEHFECPLMTRAEGRRELVWSFTAQRDASGHIDVVTGLGVDITSHKEAEAAFARSAEVSEHLRSLMVSINRSGCLEEMLDPLLTTAVDVCEMDGGGIYLIEGEEAVLKQYSGIPDAHAEEVSRLDLRSTIVQAVLHAGEPVNVGARFPERLPLYHEHGIRHVYSIALFAGDEAFGFLNLVSRRPKGPGEVTLITLRVLALEVESLFRRLKVEEALRENEEKYRTLVEMFPHSVTIFQDGKVVYANRATLEIMLYADYEAILGRPIGHAVPDSEKNRLEEYTQRRAAGDISVPNHYMTRFLRQNGEEFPAEVHISPIVYRGRPAQQVIVSDITAREEAAQALRESEEKYRNILESIQEGYYEVDRAGRFTFFNFALCQMLGYEAQEMPAVTFRDFYRDPEMIDRVISTYKHVYESGTPCQVFDWTGYRKDGSRGVFEASISLIQDKDEGRKGFRGIIRDVTEHRRAQKALEEAEARNRALLNAIPDSMIRISREGLVLDFRGDTDALNITRRREEIVGAYIGKLLREYLAVQAMERIGRALEKDAAEMLEFQLVDRDGAARDFEARICPCGADEVLAILRDISERKRNEQALLDNEAQYRELFENANDIVYTHDLEGNFLSLNKAGEEISGYTREEVRGMNAIEITLPEFRERTKEMVAKKLRGEETTRYESAIRAKDGHHIPVEVSTRLIYRDSKPVAIQGIARDITERKQNEEEKQRLQAQIQHAQKLEGLGVLAGGIAHDFNNLLVGILGNAGLALTRMPVESPARKFVEKVETTANRAAELTSQMLAYSGKNTLEKQPLNLSRMTTEMGHLLDASISKKVTLKYECEPNIPMVQGDPAQIHQVIMNLITNASEAIGEAAGLITLRTSLYNLGEDELATAWLDDNLSPGMYVCLEVSDTGCGMDENTRNRIFDPFYSTKFAGRGLGLAAVMGIIRSHDGAIKVYSEIGEGTTFRVFFPAALHGPASVEMLSADDYAGEVHQWCSSGLVLVADDEEDVRTVAEASLEPVGFDVITAVNGMDAVAMFRRHADAIRVVVLDLTMPVMNGEEALQEIHAIRPDVPVILSSGYTRQDAAGRFPELDFAGFLQKPYSPGRLIRMLYTTLEGK